MNQKFNRIRQILIALVLIAAVEGFSSCEKYSYTPPKVDPSVMWHFQTDIQPVFNAKCISCHGGVKSPDLREGQSYKSLSDGGFITLPGETSKLYTKLTGSHLSRATDIERSKILGWINTGALNN